MNAPLVFGLIVTGEDDAKQECPHQARFFCLLPYHIHSDFKGNCAVQRLPAYENNNFYNI